MPRAKIAATFGLGQQIGGQPCFDLAQSFLEVGEVVALENASQDTGAFVECFLPAGRFVLQVKIDS